MSEIKISVSDEMNKVLQKISDELGIKRAEFVKSLVVKTMKNLLSPKFI